MPRAQHRSRVHIRDVAAHAGVSLGTVSNVLNEKDSVAQGLVDRVRQSMDALGFVPNDNARQLKARASQTIAMLVLSSYNSFFSSLADAAEEEADGSGFDLILAGSAQRRDRENKYLEMFERHRVGAVLFAPIDGVTAAAERLHSRGTPIVLLGEPPREDFCTVTADTSTGGYLAVRHLLDQVRRTIWCVGGPVHQTRDRMEGARRAVAEVEGASLKHVITPDLTVIEGERAAEVIIDAPREARPDGVFALNDLVAIGLLNRLHRGSDISIPGALSIVGHDDIEFAAMGTIPLTTIRQPVEDIARASIKLALREIAEGSGHSHVHEVFSPELIVRETSIPS